MSGLILSALGQGISQAGATVGSSMTRGYEREQDEQRRARERQEDADLRRELAGVRAGGAGGSRSSGGSSGVDRDGVDVTPGSTSEEEAAAAMGMDVPAFRKFRDSQRTGDFSGYEMDGPTMDGSKVLPDKFIAEKRSKWATFLAEKGMAKGYSDLTQGRKNQQDVDLTQDVVDGEKPAGLVGSAVAAARKGEGAYKVQGNTRVNEFTGETSTTEVGKSIVDKNKSGPAPRSGGGGAPKSGNAERVRMLTDFTAREKTLRTQIGRAFGDERESLKRELEQLLEKRRKFEEGGSSEPPKRSDNAAPSRPPLTSFMR